MTSGKIRTSFLKDFLPVLIFAVCGTTAMVFLDAFDWFYHHSRRYEAYDYDELVVFMLFFSLAGMLWVFFRLYQKATRSAEYHRMTQKNGHRSNPESEIILPRTFPPDPYESLQKLGLSLPDHYRSPLLLLISLTLVITAAETIDMIILHFLPPMPVYAETLLDTTFLLIMISPALYFIFFRPLVRQFLIREEAEKGLRESEQKFRILAEQSPNMIFILKEGNVVYVNVRCEEVMGYPRKEFYRPESGVMTLLGPDSSNLTTSCFHKHKNDEDISQRECTLVSREGRKIEAILACKVIQYAGDDAILGIVTDITRQKRTEEALNQLNLELENRVAQRTAQLQKELEERKLAEERLVEQQRQLRALSSELSLVEEREKRCLAADLHDNLGHTLAMANNQLGLVGPSISSVQNKEFLDEVRKLIKESIRYTRFLTSELSSPLFHNLSFVSALKWLVEDILEKNGIIVKLKVKDTPPIQDENVRVLFLKAIREILVNIVKHARAATVEISLLTDPADIIVEIKDDGIGFDISGETQIPFPGHRGLGIFNIRERLAHLNGSVSINSKPGLGTSVILTIPRQNDVAERKR